MVWKIVRKWVPPRYKIVNGKRVYVRGYYIKVKIWVSSGGKK